MIYTGGFNPNSRQRRVVNVAEAGELMNARRRTVWIALLVGVTGLVLIAPAFARSRARPRRTPALTCSASITKAMLRLQGSTNLKNTKAYRKALKRARLVLLHRRPRRGRRLGPKQARLLWRQRLWLRPHPWRGRRNNTLSEGQVVKRGGYRHLVVFVKVGGQLLSKGLRMAKDPKGALWAVRRQEVRRKSVSFKICGCRPGRPGRGVRAVSVPWTVVLPRGKTYKGIKNIRYPVDRVFISYMRSSCYRHNVP
jgi:hypothetical protein